MAENKGPMHPSRHCWDVQSDPDTPAVLREFLEYATAPGHGVGRGPKPVCWATDSDGFPVRLVMASRFGDVGINLTGKEAGYSHRVACDDLTDFRAQREPNPKQEVSGK